MDSAEYEKRFSEMEKKVDIMAEFINSLKASVEEKKTEPKKETDLLGTLLDLHL